LDAGRERVERRGVRGGRRIDRRGLAARDDRREHLPSPRRRGPVAHLVVAAPGSGRTVTRTWRAGRFIRAAHGAVVIDRPGIEPPRLFTAYAAGQVPPLKSP
jgi:hypothetical protein